MPGGRPRKYNDEQVEAIKRKMETYINETDIPILAEFAYQNDILRETIYSYEEFITLRKKLINKKEAQLERLSLERKIQHVMAIFSLKQLGWRDMPKDDEDNTALDKLVSAIETNLQPEAATST